MSQYDDHGRSVSEPSGPGGGPQHGPPPYAPQQYGHPPYGQPPYGDPPYQQGYGQPVGFGQPYGAYGTSTAPAKPAAVITAAVLGFLLGTLGVLVSFFLFVAGAVAATAGEDLEQEVPGFGSMAGAVGGALLIAGLLALAWTVVTIWGSVWALTGRSRVLLLVGGSVALALALIGVVGSVATSGTVDILVNVAVLLAALAIVVLLASRSAAHFFAVHRYHRTGR